MFCCPCISICLSQQLTNLMHKIFVLQFVYFMPLHVLSTCAHLQEVKIVLYSFRYHHTETSEWSKIIKIQFYKYKHIVVKFLCVNFFGHYYCVLLIINTLCHVEVMFIQLLNLLERYYVYLHLCLLSLSSHKIV